MNRERWLISVMALMGAAFVLLLILILSAFNEVSKTQHQVIHLEHRELCSTAVDCDRLLTKILKTLTPRQRHALAVLVAAENRGVMHQHREHPRQHTGPAKGPTTDDHART